MTNVDTLELVGTKSVDQRVADTIGKFLHRVLLRYFPEPGKEHGVNQTRASEALGISQGHISNMLNRKHVKRGAGLALVLRLREATGASFEEITGHVPPIHPKYPLDDLDGARALAESAASEAELRAHDRPSTTTRLPPSKPPKAR